ncbi:MAG TPA: HD domain-containing phosphohydrolase [Blastocatellia bacterium]|nr:HD domain-containing phosphohydrolase [Blastocatellia bacterium]
MANRDISILVVDDEEPIRKLLAAYLSPTYSCVTATNADEATTLLATSSFNLVLTDIRMPGASGLELCQLVHQMCPETVVLMVSGQTEITYAIAAMQQGAFDYITKPFDLSILLLAVERALRYQALAQAKRHYEQSLEEIVRARTNELRSLNDNLNYTLEALYSNYRATLRALAGALEARDVETAGHSGRVVAYSLRLGKEIGLSQRDLIAVEQGALLHDIGKIGVPDAILLKRGPLSDDEWAQMRGHVDHGLRIIDNIDFLSGARPIVGQHHEKFEGSGYPNGLKGDDTHIYARVFAVADAFDAITSDRPYRAAQPYPQACSEIIRHTKRHFDPMVVDAFLGISRQEWSEIRVLAETNGYLEHFIDKQEIRSFIISLKQTGTTGSLRLPGTKSVLNTQSLPAPPDDRKLMVADAGLNLKKGLNETLNNR